LIPDDDTAGAIDRVLERSVAVVPDLPLLAQRRRRPGLEVDQLTLRGKLDDHVQHRLRPDHRQGAVGEAAVAGIAPRRDQSDRNCDAERGRH